MLRGCTESLNPQLAFYDSKNECERTNTFLSLISEVNTEAVSLIKLSITLDQKNILVINDTNTILNKKDKHI